jgi:hypothetical protein
MFEKIVREAKVFIAWTLGNNDSFPRYLLGLFVVGGLIALAGVMAVQTFYWLPSSVRIVGLTVAAVLVVVKVAAMYPEATKELREQHTKGDEDAS